MILLPTLSETIGDAALLGYDFESLASKIKNNKRGIQEYMYGYALAEDKISYLESMAEDRVLDCDRIFLLKDKLGGYVKEVEKMPHTRIIKGFYKQKDEDHTEKYVSVYRIIILNYTMTKVTGIFSCGFFIAKIHGAARSIHLMVQVIPCLEGHSDLIMT